MGKKRKTKSTPAETVTMPRTIDDPFLAAIDHLFMPPYLPQEAPNETTQRLVSVTIAQISLEAAQCYAQRLYGFDGQIRWSHIVKMIGHVTKNARNSLDKEQILQDLTNMEIGDVLAFHIEAQNAGLIIRRKATTVVFEVFEVSPRNAAVIGTTGKLICSFPGPAVQIPEQKFVVRTFQEELSSFLAQMDVDILDSAPTTRKAGSTVHEVRDTADPMYISQLLVGILRGMGSSVDIQRITKRIGDDVLWKDAYLPWRRAPLWLVIRVALQTSLVSREEYKEFMVFLMARTLKAAVEKGYSSELLSTMRAKVAQRFYKLSETPTLPFVDTAVEGAVDTAGRLLQERWDEVQQQQVQSQSWDSASLDYKSATVMTLLNSGPYIERALRRNVSPPVLRAFSPAEHARLRDMCQFSPYSDGGLTSAFDRNQSLALMDFEESVQTHLDRWTSDNLDNDQAIRILSSCLDQYHQLARLEYNKNPEEESVMILTIMQLWVALDKMATHRCTLLLEFSPEIPPKFLNPLLLRRSSSIRHANIIEQYLHRRHSATKSHRPSIFTDNFTASSFAVSFFKTRSEMASIKAHIESVARKARTAKEKELAKLNDTHARLVSRAEQLSHEKMWVTDDWTGKTRKEHVDTCQKCELEKQANSLSIAVHEWPLPRDQCKAEMVVFELACPLEFHIWRDVTFKILRDIGVASRPTSTTAHVILESYEDLRKWSQGKTKRVTIASTTKRFTQSHYKSCRIPTTASRVSVNNGLTYRLFDTGNRIWTAGSYQQTSLKSYGTYQAPDRSIYLYQWHALETTTHTSNEVLATQNNCPSTMSLHEHVAFGTLRSGGRLQWMNIAREMTANALSFGREEIRLLLMQAACELGPSGIGLDGHVTGRDWHVDLEGDGFCASLLSSLEDMLNSVSSNWSECVTVGTIVSLTSRILAAQQVNSLVATQAYQLLNNAACVTYKWVHDLTALLQATVEESQVLEYAEQLYAVAVTCRSAFDIDPDHLQFVLRTPESIAIVLHCAIVTHDNRPNTPTQASAHLQRLLARDRRLSHSLEEFLNTHLRFTTAGLDLAIREVWLGYHRGGSPWTQAEASNTRWWSCAGSEGFPQIHFNLLDGMLLVNGKPLSRLPKAIVTHRTFHRIFGQRILDVVPAAVPSMEFTIRESFGGYQVHLAIIQDHLVIQSQNLDNNETLELIPHAILSADLPEPLTRDYTHWLNLTTGDIEFRPLSAMWRSSKDNWTLNFLRSRRMVLPGDSASTYMVDMYSNVFSKLSLCLRPLDSPQHIIITYSESPSSQEVLVRLSRFNLSFFLNSADQLESRELRGKVVDDNQSSGAMFGLENQLILHPADVTARMLPGSRQIIIPWGEVEVARSGSSHHVSVHVNTGVTNRVPYHVFSVNNNLRCLTGAGGLTGWLYMIYLHAVTSHCLPDPLTGRTGTEEALYCLENARSFSFMHLEVTDVLLLRKIFELTPPRAYYPVHLRSMQTVHWSNDLPSTAQHHEFSSRVEAILAHFKCFQVFHGETNSLQLTDTPCDLLRRAACRDNSRYTKNTEPVFTWEDTCHKSRDVLSEGGSVREQVSFRVSRFVQYDREQLAQFSQPLWERISSWGQIGDPPTADTIKSLSYTRVWLSINLAGNWMILNHLCHSTSLSDEHWRHKFAFSLPAMVFANKQLEYVAHVLLALATNDRARTIDVPTATSYQLTDGFEPNRQTTHTLIKRTTLSLDSTPASQLERSQNESGQQYSARKTKYYRGQTVSAVAELTSILLSQQSMAQFRPRPSSNSGQWLNVSTALSAVRAYFRSCANNTQLKDYLHALQIALRSADDVTTVIGQHELSDCYTFDPMYEVHQVCHPPSLNVLFHRRPMRLRNDAEPPCVFQFSPTGTHVYSKTTDTRQLTHLLEDFRRSNPHPLHKAYEDDLWTSCEAFNRKADFVQPMQLPEISSLEQYLDACSTRCSSILAQMQEALSGRHLHADVLLKCKFWTDLSPRSLLQQLNLKNRQSLSLAWRDTLTSYAHSMIELQRAQRLIGFHLQGKLDDFTKEAENHIFDRNNARCHPDWLLIQIESNFFVRPLQKEVAHEMTAPQSGENSVLQLNMGEGKSSVIVPIVALTLANGEKLVQIIVLKALSRQMFQLLVERLTGLCDRRVLYMPFSRNLKVDVAHVNQIHSLKDWPDRRTTILDESDEILHVRYQLLYTIGQQQPIEDHPDRWRTIQHVLHLVHKHAPALKQRWPDEVEVDMDGRGTFPTIRIFGISAGVELTRMITEDVMKNTIPGLVFAVAPAGLRLLARSFIIDKDIRISDYALLKGFFSRIGSWTTLLLLRGLLAGGILQYALAERRWRVDYGHDFQRSLLAVPYRAKDVPSLRAEFGHPDVALVLTCLSYYYAGLTSTQLRQCFELLYKLDNPPLEYASWARQGHQIPDSLQRLSGVNPDDAQQFTRMIAPLFANNAAVADFFLSQVVFPKEAKEFPYKLATSSWDLCERSTHVTTGFSGTNDNRFLLPTSIAQNDPANQLSTNAQVLAYLLRPENSTYVCLKGRNGEPYSAREFLQVLNTEYSAVRILLDVGAQMLEFDNRSLVQNWLVLRSDVSAAVFFSESDALTVLTRDGREEPFQSSAFKDQLDDCIVYLDDAHTRGTDLKLPRDARAAVTLGPKMTKDRLLQGCMRMRKLGHGQSLMFCAPPEVDRRIRKASKQPDNHPGVANVLQWTMMETLNDIEHHIPQWAQQGVDHDRRQRAYEEYSVSRDVGSLRNAWRRPEAKTLEELYGIKGNSASTLDSDHPTFQIPAIRERLESLGFTTLSDTSMNEEQEREVNHELELEREVERPPRVEPALHRLHADVVQFVESGSIPHQSPQFVLVSRLFPFTLPAWSDKLYVTRDFVRTVDGFSSELHDYMRPVNWVVSASANGNQVFVLMSPYEINKLLPSIRVSNAVHLHIYTSRVTEWMKPRSDLSLYTVPRIQARTVNIPLQIQVQLNLFAGQLYVDDDGMYKEVERLLNIRRMEIDGQAEIKCEQQILDAFKKLVSLRRKGMGYMATHMGKILHFQPLTDEDFS